MADRLAPAGRIAHASSLSLSLLALSRRLVSAVSSVIWTVPLLLQQESHLQLTKGGTTIATTNSSKQPATTLRCRKHEGDDLAERQ